jgi:hypothetical protein
LFRKYRIWSIQVHRHWVKLAPENRHAGDPFVKIGEDVAVTEWCLESALIVEGKHREVGLDAVVFDVKNTCILAGKLSHAVVLRYFRDK